MQVFIKKARIILCYLIIAAFFIPSYNSLSGFTFISFAYKTVKEYPEITSIDVFIAIIPLILIPVSALAILVRTYMRKPIRKTIKALPLFCLLLFTAILFMTLRSVSGGGWSTLRMLSHLQGGYYIALIASIWLPFTKNPFRRKSRSSQQANAEMAL